MSDGSSAERPSPHRPLPPVLRRFVRDVLAGEMGTDVVRRLRPDLKRPDVLASKWMARPDVKAAMADSASLLARAVSAAESIEFHLGELVRILRDRRDIPPRAGTEGGRDG